MLLRKLATGALLLILLTGCCSDGVTQESVDALTAEKAILEARLIEVEKQMTPVAARIYGAFTAQVKAFVPIAEGFEEAPTYLVLETFQGGDLFLLCLSAEMAAPLETGETYRFILEEKLVGEAIGITEGMLSTKEADLHRVFNAFDVQISAVRRPLESEYGLDSLNVYWEKFEFE